MATMYIFRSISWGAIQASLNEKEVKKMKRRISLLFVLVAAGLGGSGASVAVDQDGPKQVFCDLLGCLDETDLECFKGLVTLTAGGLEIEGVVTCYDPARSGSLQ